MRLAGVSEMHMDVNQAGRHHESRRVDFRGGLLLRLAQAVDESTVNGMNVADRVALICRVDDSTAGDPKYVRHLKGGKV
jgi:hypothetical protein